MLRLRRPSDADLQRLLEDQRDRPFPYPDIGATATPLTPAAVPSGYQLDHLETDLGADDGDRFGLAGRALLAWTPQRGAGISVYPDQPVAADRAFVLVLPLPGAGWAVAPARVVYLVDQPDRFGYAYGTLPGHPERGEEAFIVVRAQGRVRFHVIAFSRPHDPLARLAAPVSRGLQIRTIGTYLRAMEAAIR